MRLSDTELCALKGVLYATTLSLQDGLHQLDITQDLELQPIKEQLLEEPPGQQDPIWIWKLRLTTCDSCGTWEDTRFLNLADGKLGWCEDCNYRETRTQEVSV